MGRKTTRFRSFKNHNSTRNNYRIETWKYVGDGIGFVIYNIAGEGGYIARVDLNNKTAKKYNIPPSTFANAFVINRPFVTSSIIGATSVKHLEENINCIDINLTDEMLNEIEDIHLSDPNPCI